MKVINGFANMISESEMSAFVAVGERWLWVPDSERRYAVTDSGKIISTAYGKCRFIKQFNSGNGYLKVRLRSGHRYKSTATHRLVAVLFVSGRCEGDQVNHKDGDKQNNHWTNLEWVTCLENTRHAMSLGLVPRRKHPIRAITGISIPTGEQKLYPSIYAAWLDGFNMGNIRQCLSGVRAKHKGCIWQATV